MGAKAKTAKINTKRYIVEVQAFPAEGNWVRSNMDGTRNLFKTLAAAKLAASAQQAKWGHLDMNYRAKLKK